ncbi:hypothetical protein BEH_10785 [Priestia filamentosa]|uniref:Uncharacterized protein n=1 Tax=Priestia filamentosa TaxID=1402861 RepID=A0A0H4KI93_9BACI|nr:hypothetical protein BEH_10785 [Priestia filamentosa]
MIFSKLGGEELLPIVKNAVLIEGDLLMLKSMALEAFVEWSYLLLKEKTLHLLLKTRSILEQGAYPKNIL